MALLCWLHTAIAEIWRRTAEYGSPPLKIIKAEDDDSRTRRIIYLQLFYLYHNHRKEAHSEKKFL